MVCFPWRWRSMDRSTLKRLPLGANEDVMRCVHCSQKETVPQPDLFYRLQNEMDGKAPEGTADGNIWTTTTTSTESIQWCKQYWNFSSIPRLLIASLWLTSSWPRAGCWRSTGVREASWRGPSQGCEQRPQPPAQGSTLWVIIGFAFIRTLAVLWDLASFRTPFDGHSQIKHFFLLKCELIWT